ncbi:DUF5993 family protein [Paraburkholderia sediminicola]|uniref:DUF5993 family protein n=1 Tax=Paraburkholderia sediminicola TaxID=458836 RepID=UPI0038BB2DC4
MLLPFLLFSGGLITACRNRRRTSLCLWTLGLVAILILFRLHATDSLNIVL